jgi:integrase
MPLTDTKAKTAKSRDKVYRIADEKGLCLEVRPNGSKLWRYRYRLDDKARMFSLGAYPDTTLEDARTARKAARELVKAGVDPVQDKKARAAADKVGRANTFKAVSEAWFAENKMHWSGGYYTQVERAFKQHLLPTLENMPVAQVTAPLLRDAIKTAGTTSPTVAILLRQWVSGVYRYAVLHDLAEYDPAAALKGLVKRPKVRHNPALAQKEIPELLAKLDVYGGYTTTKIAIRLLMLTFVRTVELRKAEWTEFDLESAIWRIPPERMKMGGEHIVPLSIQAIGQLKQLQALTGNRQYLFPNYRNPKTCMTVTTINRALERMGYAGKFSGHGFRSTASTMLNEMGYRPDLIEKQLAHVERNQVRASYNQAQYLAERTEMMRDWANLIDQLAGGSNVIAGTFGNSKESA